ncbi:MAG: hypothetical protein ACO29Z_01395, partial [Crocinitomicaceae bacterium]
MTRSLFFILLVFFAQHLSAQNLTIVIKEGKKYYQYEVKAGQNLGDLETQMVNWVPEETKKSPDRIDALVYAELYLTDRET